MGAKVRAEHRTPLFFLSVRLHRDALGWRYDMGDLPPLALDQRGCPGFCHENHMDLRRTPTYIFPRARMCSLSAYGEKSPIGGRSNHKNAGLGGCDKPARAPGSAPD